MCEDSVAQSGHEIGLLQSGQVAISRLLSRGFFFVVRTTAAGKRRAGSKRRATCCLVMDGRQDLFRYGLQPKRFLLSALVQGLADAVRRNDSSAAYRYHRRLGLIAPDFDTSPAVSDALERLLSVSGQWLATKVAERYEAEQQMLERIERIMELL